MDVPDRKRKSTGDNSESFEDEHLDLSLVSPPTRRPKPPIPTSTLPVFSPGPPQHYSPPSLPPPRSSFRLPDMNAIPSSAPAVDHPARPALRARRNPTLQAPHKSDTVPPPFPWATDRRATVHSLDHLVSQNIREISGEAQCKRCEASKIISYDLVSKFNEVAAFIQVRKHLLHDRAPADWMSPAFPDCGSCGQPNSMRPVVAAKKRSINWLFMLLGQTLGCCTLDQLKYFCKHTRNHRTGAKDRVLYLTYLGLCKQLDPTGPFDR